MSIRARVGAAWLAFKTAGWTMTLGNMEILRDVFARPSRSGKVVNEETAIQVTTVLAVVLRIAFDFAQVPWKVFAQRPGDKGRDEARDHPLWRLLHRKPNEWQTSFAFRVTMMLHILLARRFVAFVNRVDGAIVEIIPIEPRRITVERVVGSYDLRFVMTGDDGQRREIPLEMIWHIPAPSWNGWEGLDFVRLARETIGLAMAAEDNQADQQKRGGRIPGVLALEGNINKEQYSDLSEWVSNQAQKDIAETGVMLIDKAGKFYPASMTAVESQTLETRKYQATEICRHFGLFPIMIGISEGTQSYGTVEQMLIAHEIHTLDPWWVCVEQSAETSLLTEDEQKTISISFIRAGLRRASMKDMFDAFAIALGRGATAEGQAWMTANEVREFLEMNPIEGGDKLSAPLKLPDLTGGARQ